MKLGFCSLWGPSLAAFEAEIRLAAELGYEIASIGDSPAGWRDLYVSLSLVSREKAFERIATLVTSPFLRHPLASANALCTLDELSGGRMALGLATGGSTVMAIGRMPATQAEIRLELDAYRALFGGEAIEWEGRPVKALRFPRPVPIFYSAFGPKALALAGEKADGAIIFIGEQDLDGARAKIAAIRDAATRAGRNADAVDIWAVSYIAVRPSRDAAIADLKAFISVNAMALRTPEALAGVPDDIRPRILEFQARYDPSEHVVVGGRNVALMDELGLTDFLQAFDTIAGPVESVTPVLRALEDAGVSALIAALPGHAAPLETLRGLAAARAAMHQ